MHVTDDLVDVELENDPETVPVEWRNKPVRGTRTIHRTGEHSLEVVECDRGYFEWRTPSSQTILVLKGCATVTIDDGRLVELHPGRAFLFAEGSSAVWHVARPLRFVTSRAEPRRLI
jgi:uncharacterized cupin superfamily protein